MKSFLDSLTDTTSRGLEKTLDLRYRRNEAISSNIANAETPGYRARTLEFAGELERAFGAHTSEIAKSNPKHIDLQSKSNSAHLVEDKSGLTRPDGNNVDIDLQMGELASNSGKYSSAIRMLRKKIGLLRFAIRESRS